VLAHADLVHNVGEAEGEVALSLLLHLLKLQLLFDAHVFKLDRLMLHDVDFIGQGMVDGGHGQQHHEEGGSLEHHAAVAIADIDDVVPVHALLFACWFRLC